MIKLDVENRNIKQCFLMKMYIYIHIYNRTEKKTSINGQLKATFKIIKKRKYMDKKKITELLFPCFYKFSLNIPSKKKQN